MPTITVTRMFGSGGSEVARRVVAHLGDAALRVRDGLGAAERVVGEERGARGRLEAGAVALGVVAVAEPPVGADHLGEAVLVVVRVSTRTLFLTVGQWDTRRIERGKPGC